MRFWTLKDVTRGPKVKRIELLNQSDFCLIYLNSRIDLKANFMSLHFCFRDCLFWFAVISEPSRYRRTHNFVGKGSFFWGGRGETHIFYLSRGGSPVTEPLSLYICMVLPRIAMRLTQPVCPHSLYFILSLPKVSTIYTNIWKYTY